MSSSIESQDVNNLQSIKVPMEGCCLRCQLRLTGLRKPELYRCSLDELDHLNKEHNEPSEKRTKIGVCTCCLGLLQPEFWNAMLADVEKEVCKRGYDSETFACGLSFPACILIREYFINLSMKEIDPKWQNDDLVPLKQAWKWSFGEVMAVRINKKLDSGSISQFLITLHTKYEDDELELSALKGLNPESQSKSKNRKKSREEFSRASVDNTLSNIDSVLFREKFNFLSVEPRQAVECVTVECSHLPIYLGGRYAKFSRDLSQTPWIINGKRIMEGSIQEIIFEPLMQLYKIASDQSDSRLKFISSGREDVDVRCLGNGRPFAVEINDPALTKFTDDHLEDIASAMNSRPDLVRVTNLQLIHKNDLQVLKMGEEVKTKTYEALCIKLKENTETCSDVTECDIKKINSYSNCAGDARVQIVQKTPLRVLHRRPLLSRNRKIHKMEAFPVKDKSNMFTLELTTEAGTYIKEFIHGDFGRTVPNLSQILGCRADILALDVMSVNLDWPTEKLSNK